jgi:hypothetical protein
VLPWPALFMKVRRETVELSGMAGNRRGEDPRRIHCDTSQGPNAEDARQDGQIRGRSRNFMNCAGQWSSGRLRRPSRRPPFRFPHQRRTVSPG